MSDMTSNCSENHHEERCCKNGGNVWCGYEYHKEKCEKGEHHFIECDEWERTCLYCGKFEK